MGTYYSRAGTNRAFTVVSVLSPDHHTYEQPTV